MTADEGWPAGRPHCEYDEAIFPFLRAPHHLLVESMEWKPLTEIDIYLKEKR